MTPSANPPGELLRPDLLSAAQGVASTLALHADAADRVGRLAMEDLEALRRSGLLGLMVPTRIGGHGASFAEYAQIAMTLAGGSGAVALVFNMHASVTGALAQTPDEMARALGAAESYFAMRDRALDAARHGSLFAVAMSERTAGARLSSLETTYWRETDGFRIVGSKAFVSGAGCADMYLVAARPADDAGVISYFLVPAGEGVVVEDTWDALGMRATGSHDLHLDVKIPADALVGGIEGIGLALADLMPQWLVASYAAVYVGVAQAAVDAAVDHVRARSLENLPAVRSRIGRADAAVSAARVAVLEAAQRVDRSPGDSETNRWVWRAKLLAGETAMAVAASMLEASGSSASRRGHPLERLYRDARCGSLQPATSDVCADWLGYAALGLDPNRSAEFPRW